jgi:hypothetical protein
LHPRHRRHPPDPTRRPARPSRMNFKTPGESNYVFSDPDKAWKQRLCFVQPRSSYEFYRTTPRKLRTARTWIRIHCVGQRRVSVRADRPTL